MPYDDSHLEYARPAEHVRSVNVEPIPQRIFDGMKMYEEAARGFEILCIDEKGSSIFVSHRPEDAQVSQVYRMSTDPSKKELERLTYFNVGSGRQVTAFSPIDGDDWRGVWRGGGTIMLMDLDGSEMSQLWRYWEDQQSPSPWPHIDGELDNKPGRGRIERLTHDEFKYTNLCISPSNKLIAFSCNKENKRDTLVYVSPLVNSNAGSDIESSPLHLPSTIVTPLAEGKQSKKTVRWMAECISVDDQYLLLTVLNSTTDKPLYYVDLNDIGGGPKQIALPGATEKLDQTAYNGPTFSKDPTQPGLLYVVTDAYGDFKSVVSYDLGTQTVLHITTPDVSPPSLRPIPWNAVSVRNSETHVVFRANVEGWERLFIMPLTGYLSDEVVEVCLDWEGGSMASYLNEAEPDTLIVRLLSYRSYGSLAKISLSTALENGVQVQENGDKFVSVPLTRFSQATASQPSAPTRAPQLLKFKSFDGLTIPVMYYHPNEGRTRVPLLINIHGGPESQSTSRSRMPIHSYVLNEMKCAVMNPNVRGSAGYGKKFLAADDVEKREDSVNDIGVLLDYVRDNMQSEIDSSRIAVMGGSYGGYMVYSCLTHFSSKLTCGLANFGIAHWPSFFQNTAASRRDNRRREYGDERIPEIRDFLERISPLNNASNIRVPLSIAHGETDSRVTIDEAIRMFEIVSSNGIRAELTVCEKEGHGFKQKSVIEFTNAAKIHFLERYLLQQTSP